MIIKLFRDDDNSELRLYATEAEKLYIQIENATFSDHSCSITLNKSDVIALIKELKNNLPEISD